MADHCERWMWRDPGEIIDRLLARSAPRPSVSRETVQPSAQTRDRHYTQARRLHIQKLMRSR